MHLIEHMSDTIQTPHDAFFKKAMQIHKTAFEFFESHLPPTVKAQVNLQHLKPLQETFIDQTLRYSMSDLLFETQIQQQSGYLYLLVEHQSQPDPLMPFRLLKYMIAIMDRHLKQEKNQELPLIYPMIFYTGKKPYTHSTDLLDLFGSHKALAQSWMFTPFQLIDLSHLDDEALAQHPWSGLMALMMKHIYEQNILPFLKDRLVPLLQAIQAEPDGIDYTEILFHYLLNKSENRIQPVLETLHQGLINPTGDKTMATMAEQLIEQGMQKGLQHGLEQGMETGILKGKQAVAMKLLSQGSNIHFIAELTELSIEQIKALQAQMNH